MAREHAAGRGTELRPHDLVVEVGPDLDIEIIKLAHNRAINDRELYVELEPLERDGAELLVLGRIGDVEIVDPSIKAEAMIAGLEHALLQAATPRIEEQATMAWFDDIAATCRQQANR